ncbi:MAG: response regulator, partial [Myxococcales bacterium]|nr:response regulator [Myxococcales bacterium]
LALCGLAVVIGSLVRGTTDVGVAPVTALLFALVPVVFRLSRSYSAAAWSFVALAMMLAVTFIPTHGGLLSVHALWLPLLPAVVLVVLDYRAAVASVFFVFGFGFVLVAGHTRGLVPAPLSEPTPVDVAVVVLCSSLVFLAVSHTREVAVGDLLEDRVSEARARARAEAASRAKSSILASVSHELRTPMTGILGLADLLSETSLDRKQSDWVRTIHKTGHALLALLDDLLDTARLDSGNLTLKQRPFRPLELAEQVVALFRPRARGKRIALHLEVAPDVAVKVLGDAARIRQVLINLVGNAVKFTHQGGIVLRVQQDDHVLVFEVTDSGVGIPRDRLEDVFTPFVRAEADHASAAGGVGLGLSIARLLVEAMDGEISVRSEEQVGTTFQVRLPLEVLDADAPTTETSSYRPRPDASLRVLVAEDNPVNRMVITAMLESMGHEVRVAHNGDEVVPTARAFHPDVCLMDMRMPVVDGLEATRRLRADARFDRVRVIAL